MRPDVSPVRHLIPWLVVLAVANGGGCKPQSSVTVVGPSEAVPSLAGQWTSPVGVALAQTCTDIRWQISQDGNQATGDFTATCAGNITLSGTVSATLSGTVITWSASGTAETPQGVSCPFSLSGTGNIQGNTIVIPYSGSTCLGPLSGTETLTR